MKINWQYIIKKSVGWSMIMMPISWILYMATPKLLSITIIFVGAFLFAGGLFVVALWD